MWYVMNYLFRALPKKKAGRLSLLSPITTSLTTVVLRKMLQYQIGDSIFSCGCTEYRKPHHSSSRCDPNWIVPRKPRASVSRGHELVAILYVSLCEARGSGDDSTTNRPNLDFLSSLNGLSSNDMCSYGSCDPFAAGVDGSDAVVVTLRWQKYDTLPTYQTLVRF